MKIYLQKEDKAFVGINSGGSFDWLDSNGRCNIVDFSTMYIGDFIVLKKLIEEKENSKLELVFKN